MGEIADSLLDGEFDSVTGEYLGEGVGYPRTTTDGNPFFKKGRNQNFGIRNYLNSIDVPHSKQHEFCLGAIREINQKPYKSGKSWNGITSILQNNWSEFINYSNKNKPCTK